MENLIFCAVRACTKRILNTIDLQVKAIQSQPIFGQCYRSKALENKRKLIPDDFMGYRKKYWPEMG